MHQEMKKAEQAFAIQVEENEERHRRDLHHIYEQFALARQRVFGRSSESHLNQLDLSFDEAEGRPMRRIKPISLPLKPIRYPDTRSPG